MEKSRAYSKIVNRLKSNTYKTDKKQKKANRAYLIKTKSKLTQKNNTNIKYKKGHTHKLEKLNAILEELGSPGSNSGSAEVGINETLAQGDCFFSSLWRAFKERGLLETVAYELNVRTSTEVRFIISMRKKIADEILANRLPTDVDQHGKKEDTYDFFHGLGPLITDVLNEDDDEIFPDWFKQEFLLGVGTRKNFLRKTAKWVKKRKEYAGELEVAIAKRLLADKGILLEIDGTTKRTLPKEKSGLPLITLFNAYGGHYEYYTFNPKKCPKNRVRNPVTLKCTYQPKPKAKTEKQKSAEKAKKVKAREVAKAKKATEKAKTAKLKAETKAKKAENKAKTAKLKAETKAMKKATKTVKTP
jgi:hypothetical protein